jgi:hypothetical protein
MRLVDHVTLNFSSNMLMAAIFLDIEKDSDTTWHSGSLYKLSGLEFSTSPIVSYLLLFSLTENLRSW